MKDVREKLVYLSRELNAWSSKNFGAVKTELRELRKKLECLRENPMRTCPSEEEAQIENRIIELNIREEIMWKQRSRILWLSEGDDNTKFFHQMASKRRSKNCIDRLT